MELGCQELVSLVDDRIELGKAAAGGSLIIPDALGEVRYKCKSVNP